MNGRDSEIWKWWIGTEPVSRAVKDAFDAVRSQRDEAWEAVAHWQERYEQRIAEVASLRDELRVVTAERDVARGQRDILDGCLAAERGKNA